MSSSASNDQGKTMSAASPSACPLPKERVQWWEGRKTCFPHPRAVLLPLLHDIQDHRGMLGREEMAWAAEFVGISPVEVLGVLTFYWMYDRNPRAKFRVAVCRNISCDLRGAKEIVHALEKKLGIQSDKPVKEGASFALREVECMGSCTTAPMMDVNGSYFEELTPEKALEIIDQIEKGVIALPPEIETLPEIPKNLAHSYGSVSCVNGSDGNEEAS